MAIKIGVIGVGYLGAHHARIYSSMDGVQLCFIADENSASAAAAAEKFGGQPVTDFRQMLKDVDAVSIVTPTTTHHAVAMECLRAGVDVLVEKPITVTVSEADELIAEAASRSRILQVGHLERYNPSVVRLMELVNGPVFIEAERVSPFQGRGADVDITLDLMIHDIDIVFGMVAGREVTGMRAAGARIITDRIDAVSAWIEFEGGTTARLSASRVAGEKRRLLSVIDRDAAYELDYQKAQITRHAKVGGEVRAEVITVEQKEPLREELIDFIDCIKTRRRPRVSGEDARRALRTADEIAERIAAP